MRYPHYPGVGKRLREQLLARGYEKDGDVDVARFLAEHRHYDPRSFYPWLKDRTPSPDKLAHLARDLNVSVAWLLLGVPDPTPPTVPSPPRRRPAPIRGGSGAAHPLPIVDGPDAPYRKRARGWLRRLVGPLTLPVPCPA